MIDWGNVASELTGLVLGTMILAIGGAFTLWLKNCYARLKSIDLATQELHVIAKMVQDHEARISNIEDWKIRQHNLHQHHPHDLNDDIYE